MTSASNLKTRVLAVDPTPRGFAFVVFEGPELLLDWGLSDVKPDRKNALCLTRIESLMSRYVPDVVVLEAYDGRGSHRRRRVRSLIRSIRRLASRRGFRSRTFSRGQIRRAFGALGKATKHPIAVEIAQRFPELAERLPRVRKPWMSEDERMSIFDAAAMALTYFEARRKRSRPFAEAA
jgi:hypothetical protein